MAFAVRMVDKEEGVVGNRDAHRREKRKPKKKRAKKPNAKRGKKKKPKFSGTTGP